MECKVEDEVSLLSNPSANLSLDLDEVLVKRFICDVEDLPANTLCEFFFDEKKILLARQRGKVYAVGDKCTHKDAEEPVSLVLGSLGRGRVRCAQCGSAYLLATGEVEEFPAINPLPCYKVDVEDNRVHVSIKQGDLQYQAREYRLVMPRLRYRSRETYAVVGGGPAAAMCMEHLRKLGFTGKLVAFLKEAELPYDRTVLSKDLAAQGNAIQLRSYEFYHHLGVDLFLSTSVQHVSITENTLVRSDGALTTFDKVFIATGAEAKRLPAHIPGATDATGLFYLRSITDAREAHAALSQDTDLVVLGSSFLALEVAVTCLPLVNSLTLISEAEYPFLDSFGAVIGAEILNLFRNNGVVMRMGAMILRLEMDPDTLALTGVVLSDGLVPAQMAIACLGVTCATHLLKDSGVDLTPEGAVAVNQYLVSNIPYVYAGGDIAWAPLHPYFNSTVTGTHYQVALYHGKVAAANMLGLTVPLRTIPFLNISLGEVILQYVGHIKHVDNMQLVGSLCNFTFAAYYMEGDRVTGLVTCGLGPLAAQFAETVHMDKPVMRESLRNHAWARRMFTCIVHERDEDYTLDLAKLKQMGLVF